MQSAIRTDEIIKQYEDDKPFLNCLLLRQTEQKQHIHVVSSIKTKSSRHLVIVMSRPKQQHIVPKVYLRYFCDTKNKNQIYFYDKIDDKTALTSINNVAQERGFYSDQSKEDNDYYEKYYSNSVEPELGKLLAHIVMAATMYSSGTTLITDKYRRLLSKMLVMQMLRTRNARKLLREKFNSVTDQILINLLELPIISEKKDILTVIEKYRKPDENIFKEVSLSATVNEARLTNYTSLLDTMICVTA